MKRDPKQSGDQLNAFLKAGDPVEPSALSGDGVESALDEIGAAIVEHPRRAGSRRSFRFSITKPRAALVVGFAAIGIGGAVAAGSQLSAHTGGFQPTPREITKARKTNPEKAKYLQWEFAKAGPGEVLDPAGGDFRAAALQLSSDIPYPVGYESWHRSVAEVEVDAAPNSGAMVVSGQLRFWFAMNAYCAWVLDWRQAEIAGERDIAAKATTAISEAPNWPALTAMDIDPDPPLPPKSNYDWVLGWMLPYRDAVLAGNRASVDHLLITGEYDQGKCQVEDPVWRELLGEHRRDPSWEHIEERYADYLAGKYS